MPTDAWLQWVASGALLSDRLRYAQTLSVMSLIAIGVSLVVVKYFYDWSTHMDYHKFCDEIESIYQSLPEELKHRFTISIEEYPTDGSQKLRAFGYWNPYTPDCMTLCYWVFAKHGDFYKEHLERVIRHEFEHVVGSSLGIPHSEHPKHT